MKTTKKNSPKKVEGTVGAGDKKRKPLVWKEEKRPLTEAVAAAFRAYTKTTYLL